MHRKPGVKASATVDNSVEKLGWMFWALVAYLFLEYCRPQDSFFFATESFKTTGYFFSADGVCVFEIPKKI